ncbi:MAG: SDR family NAD(P)-dependent oxidoreductase [Vulcanimicrobiaceae bacterium]
MERRSVALVTGASGGIGLELAKLLAGGGYDLALVARSGARLEQIAAVLRGTFGVTVRCIVKDLAQPGAPREIFGAIPECDVLVNNAGFANNGRFAEIPEQQLLDEVNLNAVAVTHLTRLYLPGMLARSRGRVLNIASTAAFLPGPLMAVYYATKAYVLSFSEALWEETRGSGVTVTCLCPGPTATGFQKRANVEETPLFRMKRADPASVAKAGFEGMLKGKRVVIPGLFNKFVAITPHLSPRRILLLVSRKMIERRREQ